MNSKMFLRCNNGQRYRRYRALTSPNRSRRVISKVIYAPCMGRYMRRAMYTEAYGTKTAAQGSIAMLLKLRTVYPY